MKYVKTFEYNINESKTMTNSEIEKLLLKNGFKIDRVNNNSIYMSKRKGGSSLLATIEDEEINGEDPKQWLKNILNESSNLIDESVLDTNQLILDTVGFVQDTIKKLKANKKLDKSKTGKLFTKFRPLYDGLNSLFSTDLNESEKLLLIVGDDYDANYAVVDSKDNLKFKGSEKDMIKWATKNKIKNIEKTLKLVDKDGSFSFVI